MDSVTQLADSAMMEGVKNTAIEAINEASMWSTATSVFVVLFILAVVAIVIMAMVIKNKNVLIDQVVLQMDNVGGNPTHNPTARNYVGSLSNNKWFAKRYLK